MRVLMVVTGHGPQRPGMTHRTDGHHQSHQCSSVLLSLPSFLLSVLSAAIDTPLLLPLRAASCQHGLGSLALACFIFDGWQCGLFWWIFALTVVAPLLTEVSVLLRLFSFSSSGQMKQRLQQS